MKSNMVLTLILTAGIGFSCQKGTNNSGEMRHRSGRGQGTSFNMPGPFQTQIGQNNFVYSQARGRIFSDARYSSEFNGALRALVSASMDSQDLGHVNPLSGVKLKGYVELDNQGRLLPSTSQIVIEIHDEFTSQIQNGISIPPIQIAVMGESGFASGSQVQLKFQDQYGWIFLTGSYTDGGRFSGFLSFQNSNGRAGEGLSFEVETCGFFRCH